MCMCVSTLQPLHEQPGGHTVRILLCFQDFADLHVVALSVLARCLEDTENMQALQSSGCLNKLLEYVKDSTSAELKQNAVSGVHVCVCVSDNEYVSRSSILMSALFHRLWH